MAAAVTTAPWNDKNRMFVSARALEFADGDERFGDTDKKSINGEYHKLLRH